MNATDQGATALVAAAFKPHCDTVKALLETGADVNTTTKDGFIALMAAAQEGHRDIVNSLECGTS